MALTTSGDLSPAVRQDLAKRMLSVKTPNLIYKPFAMKDQLEAYNGDIKRYRRYNKLSLATEPLGPSGNPVSGQTLSAIDLDAKINYYGDFVGITTQVLLANQERVLNQCALLLGIQLRETEDKLIRQSLESGVQKINAVFGVNGNVPTEFTQEDAEEVVSSLLDNSAGMFLSGIRGADIIGSSPVRNAYIALATTRLTKTLQRQSDFIATSRYGDQAFVMDGEWGAINNVRYFVSPVGSVSSIKSDLGLDVANVMFVSKESYACILQDGASAELYYNPPYLSDQLRQSVSMGWTMGQVSRVLNTSWIANLQCSLG